MFFLRIDEATKDCRGDEICELLYTDGLLLTAKTKEETEQKLLDWRQAMAKRELKVNVAGTKVMATGKNAEVVRSGRYSCDDMYVIRVQVRSQSCARSIVSGAITDALVCAA